MQEENRQADKAWKQPSEHRTILYVMNASSDIYIYIYTLYNTVYISPTADLGHDIEHNSSILMARLERSSVEVSIYNLIGVQYERVVLSQCFLEQTKL